jgi:hypothetical protein
MFATRLIPQLLSVPHIIAIERDLSTEIVKYLLTSDEIREQSHILHGMLVQAFVTRTIVTYGTASGTLNHRNFYRDSARTNSSMSLFLGLIMHGNGNGWLKISLSAITL